MKHFNIISISIYLLFISLSFLLAGCASIVGKTQYPIEISSNPSGARYVVTKENGTIVSKGITPSSVILKSSSGYFQPAKYVVNLDYKGEKQQFLCDASINPWYFANCFSWGLIGFIVVDPLTGAMWKLDKTGTINFNS